MNIDIFGAAWCSACKVPRAMLDDAGVAYTYLDIDSGNNLALLEKKLGRKAETIPQIFVDGKKVDVLELQSAMRS